MVCGKARSRPGNAASVIHLMIPAQFVTDNCCYPPAYATDPPIPILRRRFTNPPRRNTRLIQHDHHQLTTANFSVAPELRRRALCDEAPWSDCAQDGEAASVVDDEDSA